MARPSTAGASARSTARRTRPRSSPLRERTQAPRVAGPEYPPACGAVHRPYASITQGLSAGAQHAGPQRQRTIRPVRSGQRVSSAGMGGLRTAVCTARRRTTRSSPCRHTLPAETPTRCCVYRARFGRVRRPEWGAVQRGRGHRRARAPWIFHGAVRRALLHPVRWGATEGVGR